MNQKVVGSRGHMDGDDHVTDEVVVQIEDGGDVVLGRGPTEKAATAAARDELKRFRAEQAMLNTPAVVAAREALAEAMRQARES